MSKRKKTVVGITGKREGGGGQSQRMEGLVGYGKEFRLRFN